MTVKTIKTTAGSYENHATEQAAFATFRADFPECVAMPLRQNDKAVRMSAIYASASDADVRSIPVGFVIREA